MESSRRLPEIIDGRQYGQHGYPHAIWDALRRDARMHWFEGAGIKPFWAVVRHRDVQSIAEQPHRFLNAPRIMADMDVRPNLVWSRHLLNMDPPEHDAWRSLLAPRFGARALKPALDGVRRSVQQATARMFAGGATWEGDFAAIAADAATGVVAELLGVTAGEHERLQRWAHALVAPADPELRRGRSTEETYVQAERELFAWFAPRLAERRARPCEDLLSLLAGAEIFGRPIAPRDALSFCQLFVTAGIETTSAALSRCVQALAERPDQLRWLRDHRADLPIAIEELLRFTSPVIHFCRTAAENADVAGVPVLRGQTLVLFYASANRDEEVFERASELWLGRRGNPHLAFGAGSHYCLGAPLARRLLHAFLDALLERVVALEPAGPPSFAHCSVIGGVKRLPLRCVLAAG